jgi:hypothetical protein
VRCEADLIVAATGFEPVTKVYDGHFRIKLLARQLSLAGFWWVTGRLAGADLDVVELTPAVLTFEVRRLDNAAGTVCPCATHIEDDDRDGDNGDGGYGRDYLQILTPA